MATRGSAVSSTVRSQGAVAQGIALRMPEVYHMIFCDSVHLTVAVLYWIKPCSRAGQNLDGVPERDNASARPQTDIQFRKAEKGLPWLVKNSTPELGPLLRASCFNRTAIATRR